MNRRYRNHSPAFKARLAIEVAKEKKAINVLQYLLSTLLEEGVLFFANFQIPIAPIAKFLLFLELIIFLYQYRQTTSTTTNSQDLRFNTLTTVLPFLTLSFPLYPLSFFLI